MKPERAYLADILDQSEFITRQVRRIEREEFFLDEVLSRALLHSLLIIGEAANRLSPEFLDRSQDIPWPKIVALRNRIVHDYAGIDLELIWNICDRDIPALADSVRSQLETGQAQ